MALLARHQFQRADPASVLRSSRERAVKLAGDSASKGMRDVLRRAERDLAARVVAIPGPSATSFTAAQLQATLSQVRAVLADVVKPGMKGVVLDAGELAATQAAKDSVDYMQQAEDRFTGISQPLAIREAAVLDRARVGARSSILHRLEGDPQRGPGILQRYGAGVVESFESILQQRFIQKMPWGEARERLTQASPFLQEMPGHWAERIVRTEVMGAHNRASLETFKEAEDQLGGMLKILCATFDDRTAADSYAVHGQIRRVSEAFDTWQGPVMTPPARPNDREVVVPHRMSWPLPANLQPRSSGEVQARWVMEGRKGPHPPIPKRSTVDVSLIGKPQPKKEPPKPAVAPLVLTHPKELPMPAPIQERPAFVVPPEQGGFAFGPGGISPKPFQVLEPEASPEPPKPRHEVILGEQVSGQKGSNAGGVYKGSDGVERYVKFYPDAAQAEMENLTNAIYRALKIDAPESEVFKTGDGKVAYASKIEQGKILKDVKLDQKTAQGVMKGFVADVLVGNWDAVGTGLDNVLVKKGGKPVRIDTGGSLLMRAKQGRKPDHVLNQISEWDLFFDSGKNPYYSQVAKAAGVTSARDVPHVKSRIRDVVNLRKKYGDWHAFVRDHAPNLNQIDAKKIGDMLESRTKLLQKKLKEMKPLPKGYVPIEQRPTKAIPRNQFSIPMGYESHVEWHREYDIKHDQKLDALAKQVPKFYSAMRDYTGSDYRMIRATKTMGEAEWRAKYPGSDYARRRAQYDALDKAFEIHDEAIKRGDPSALAYAPEARVKEGFRGLHDLSREALDNIIQKSEFKVESVTSTSWDVEPARRFMYQSGEKFGAMLHFKYKSTSAGKLAVQKQSSVGEGEREILLREGKRFKIDSVHRAAENPKLVYIELTEL